MSQFSIECIAASLIREYLSRKGFKDTLDVLDIESPRTTASISNRMDLMKALHFQSQMKKNKESHKPYKTMVEVMTKYFTERVKLKGDSMEEFDASSSKTAPTSSTDGKFTSSERQTSAVQQVGSRQGDLVIDDDIEGETVVGEGKGGLFNKQEQELNYNLGVLKPKKKSLNKMRGLSGPVSSSLNERDKPRQMKYGRPLSWQKAPSTSVEEEERPELKSSVSMGATADKRYRQSNFTTAGSLLNNNNNDTDPVKNSASSFPLSARKSIKDVLGIEIEANQRKTPLSRLPKNGEAAAGSGQEKCGYSVSQSSIAQDEPSRSCSGSSKTSSEASPSMRRAKMPAQRGQEKSPVEIRKKNKRDPDAAGSDTEFTGEAELPSPVKLQFSSTIKSTPIDLDTAKELKMLIFGSLNLSFPGEWKYQGFTFSDVKKLQFGFVQNKAGPCGVLASVQAVLLQELLFANQRKASPSVLQPSPEKRSSCLCRALAKILWRAGDGKQAVVTVPTGRPQFPLPNNFKGDNLTETLLLYCFDDYKDLLLFLQQNIAQFELHGNHGAIHSLFSTVLSRTISRVKKDMDRASNKLLSAHFNCNQELVNLFLTGKAASNIFNDTMELESEGKETTILHGLSARNEIGFLSLFEHYKSCQVGTYYKTPVFPIWVICSETHFSVLFCLNRDLMNNWRAERRFDLYYYDGLANQEQEVRLTIDTTSKYYQPPTDEDMVPAIDKCIRTKWDEAEVDWNGTEPLL